MVGQLSSVFARYLCPAHMTRQTTLRPSVRTSKTCTTGSQAPSSASDDHRDTGLTILTMTEIDVQHRKQILQQLEGHNDYG